MKKSGRVTFESYLNEFVKLCVTLRKLNLIEVPASIKYKSSQYQDYMEIQIPHRNMDPLDNVDNYAEKLKKSQWARKVKVKYA